MEKDLTKFDHFVYKKYRRGSRSKEVKAVRIKEDIIILKTSIKKERYLHEKSIYMKLKDEDFLPKLKYFDDGHLILGLTDVGETITIYKLENTEEYNKLVENINKQIKDIIDKLLDKYGLYHNDLHHSNICIDNNKIVRIIDFDSASKKILKSTTSARGLQIYRGSKMYCICQATCLILNFIVCAKKN